MIQVKEGEDAKQMCLESIEIFQSGGMTLREFSGLSPNELRGFPTENLATDQNNVKILGIPWARDSDTIILKLAKFNGKPTKRTLLSTIAKVYDPLGLVSPIVLQAKFILQRVFEANYKWDAPLDDKLSEEWLKLMEFWSSTNTLIIPRLIKNNPKKELHCFTDASGQGFGAAVYLRTFNNTTGGTTKLIFAKSLVKPASLPINASTIPKLELQALTLGSKIIRYLQKELIIEANSITLWSDSQCNIERLKKFGKYDRFVNNRLAKIRDLCPVKHVTTENNPADLCSRGTTPQGLIGNELWFLGPKWLQNAEENWPTPLVIYKPGQELDNEEENDIEIQAVIEEQIPEGIIDVLRFSKYKKLISTLAYVFKFIKKMKKLIHPEEGEIVQNEIKMKDLKEAERYLIKTTQARHPPPKDVISSLKMYKTIDGTWRCKGRLDESELKSEAKNPIFLPRESWVTKLLILDLHFENKHCGSSTLLSIIRQNYWIQREIDDDEEYMPTTTTKNELTKQLKNVQLRLNNFWKFWKSNYLLSLREKLPKGQGEANITPKEGDIVLVEDENLLPRSLWKAAKIVELIRGRDNIIRTAKILINGKILKRSINQLFRLEVQPELETVQVMATIETSKPVSTMDTSMENKQRKRKHDENQPMALQFPKLAPGFKIPKRKILKPKRMSIAAMNMLYKSLGGNKYSLEDQEIIRQKIALAPKLSEEERKEKEEKMKNEALEKYKNGFKKRCERGDKWYDTLEANVSITTEPWDKTMKTSENLEIKRAAQNAAREERGIQLNESLQKISDIQTPAPKEQNVFYYNVLHECKGELHK
uniref:DUF5641 domain-containing protein n=1 Tax=Meloidogyne floridensis TaxID=298350 RepID=A0A915P756_9BILA